MEINKLIQAYRERKFASFFDENPKSYDPSAKERGLNDYNQHLNGTFELDYNVSSSIVSDEKSPYTLKNLNITYPVKSVNSYISDGDEASKSFPSSVEKRFEILSNALDNVSSRFFELAYATMHTTGQSFMMSFQASGPHAADRALESMVVAYMELTEFPEKVDWVKDFGKFQLKLEKDYIPVPKGTGLIIGCSTFPTWNSVTGLFANLMCGVPCIVKPHPLSILPMAIFVQELRRELTRNGFNANMVQLAVDSLENPITTELAEDERIKLIDYTGGNEFGNYIEELEGKTTFTEKAGVNSCIVDSFEDMKAVCSNIAFSASLYSGQMCTAPQNIFISQNGVQENGQKKSSEEFIQELSNAFKQLAEHPKAGPATLGAIQNERTIARVEDSQTKGEVALTSSKVTGAEFASSRTVSPVLRVFKSNEIEEYGKECFGPIINIVLTNDQTESLNIAVNLALENGALTCLCYTTDKDYQQKVKDSLNKVFVPVSFNFTGAAFVNQHAAFSDLHVTGGNPAGNATFTNREYVAKRIVWVGNRYM